MMKRQKNNTSKKIWKPKSTLQCSSRLGKGLQVQNRWKKKLLKRIKKTNQFKFSRVIESRVSVEARRPRWDNIGTAACRGRSRGSRTTATPACSWSPSRGRPETDWPRLKKRNTWGQFHESKVKRNSTCSQCYKCFFVGIPTWISEAPIRFNTCYIDNNHTCNALRTLYCLTIC